MKKILYIIPYIPYPLTSGGNQAFFSMIEFLRHKLEVSVLLTPKKGKQEVYVEELKKLWDNVNFFVFTEAMENPEVSNSIYYKWLKKVKRSVDRKIKRRLFRSNENMLRNKSTLFTSVFTPFNKDYLKYISAVAQQGFDIIQVEFYELLSLGYLLPDNVETIFVHHELRYVRNENEMNLFDQVSEEENMLFRIAKDFELSALRTYNHLIVLTETDRRILANFIGREDRIYASPAILEMPATSKEAFVPATCRLTFVGGEDHLPNLDAVSWFCKDIAPYLRNQGIRFSFQVVGCWHSSYAKALSASCSELEFVGYVEDLHGYLKGSIGVVPVRIGSGMRMKILDAVSSQIPFVTTSKGVEGLDLRDGKECLIADAVTDFGNAILRLIDDKDLQSFLAHQAGLRFCQLYKPQDMLEKRLSIYTEVLKDKV